MRWLALGCCLLLLSALIFAQEAPSFAPPPLEPPDEKTRDLIEQRTDQLETAVERLGKVAVRDPGLADVEIFLRAAQRIVKHNEFYKNGGKQTLQVLDQGLLRAAQAGRGQAPWLTSPAGLKVIRAYRSRIDGSLQPFAVTYPADYQDKKAYRLDVVLHGRSDGLTEVGFIATHNAKDAPKDQKAVRIDVYGRGNNAYRWAGEVDVFEAVENFFAAETYAQRGGFVDPAKIVLRGFSMGGAGAWHIGLHRPDQWCVVNPGAGFTTTHGYAPKDKVPEKLPNFLESCLRIYDAVDYVENAFNVPIVAYSGEEDKQKKAADEIETRLKKLELTRNFEHLIAPKTGHRIIPEYEEKLQKAFSKWAATPRPDYAEKVRFVTYTLKYPSCYWVELMGLDKHYQQARVEASRSKDEKGFVVKTTNVRILRLALWPGAIRTPIPVQIDGQEVIARPHKAADLFVYLEKQDGKWASVRPERLFVDRLRTPQKVAGLQGPIDDAFTAPFLCVKGTGTPWHERTAEYAEADLERFKKEWSKYFRGELPVKEDTEVTADDVAGRHLILFGDPSSNSLIAEALPRLPLKWTKKSITFDGKEYDSASHVPVLIYPNPLAADRYVVLNSGHTFHEAEFTGTNALLFPRLGDHAILKLSPQKDKNGPLTCEVQSAGLFDDFWRVVGGEKP